ncbi:hypothetical protein [Kitasatospora sp. NPDC087314]|uniref:hypothetical protein n=1 Tax=Kitasatospora sp. NPDC087314 TaxID=3364068 RepID=UPI00382206BE
MRTTCRGRRSNRASPNSFSRAWCLARDGDAEAALRRYDRMRRPAVNAIVLANRDLGPEETIARAEEHGGELPLGQAEEIATRYQRLAGAAVTQVNAHGPCHRR